MKNFGFADLWIVTPHPPTWSEIVSAVNAEDVLAQARIAGSLAEAVADCTLIIGTADRTRVEEKQSVYTPADLSREQSTSGERIALVFGTEKHGLTNEDLSFCNRVMSIPTRHECPSMNLGQAVAVCCYELSRETAQPTEPPIMPKRPTGGAAEAALRLTVDVLRSIDFILPGNEPELTRRVRRSMSRLNLTHYDVVMLCGVLDRIKRGLKLNSSDQNEQAREQR
jgi:TrmH family RNA methyltransferase